MFPFYKNPGLVVLTLWSQAIIDMWRSDSHIMTIKKFIFTHNLSKYIPCLSMSDLTGACDFQQIDKQMDGPTNGHYQMYTLLQKKLKFSKVAFLLEKIVCHWALGHRQNLKDLLSRSATQGHQGKWTD